jgi:hypothetical protein
MQKPAPRIPQIQCPACGGKCCVSASRQMTTTVRVLYLTCADQRCGWRGVGHVSIDKTLTPSFQGPSGPPPISSPERRRDIIEELLGPRCACNGEAP